jgi:proteasome lid subunit RPN8/RPN11
MIEKEIGTRITLAIDARKTLFADVRQRQETEACGVLLGTIDGQGNWHIQQARPLRNIFESPVYFEFDPQELLEAEMLSAPAQIVGVYHSHPTGYASASLTDRENMRRVNCEQDIPWAWLIIPGPFDEAFVRRYHGAITDAGIIAYYHAETGLQRIAIAIEQEEMVPGDAH